MVMQKCFAFLPQATALRRFFLPKASVKQGLERTTAVFVVSCLREGSVFSALSAVENLQFSPWTAR